MLEPELLDALRQVGFVAAKYERNEDDDETGGLVCEGCDRRLDTYTLPPFVSQDHFRRNWHRVDGHADDCPVKRINDFIAAYDELEREEVETRTEAPGGWIAGPADQVMYHAIAVLHEHDPRIMDINWRELASEYAVMNGGAANSRLTQGCNEAFLDGQNGRPFVAR